MKVSIENLSGLFKTLGIKPKDESIYVNAFIHPSYAHEKRLRYDYQRLEFLGDAIIEMVVSDYLFRHFPKEMEGNLTKMRICLVQAETEIAIAKKMHLDHYIRVGESLAKQVLPESLLEDCFEALIGAIYLDLGQKVVVDIILKWLLPLLPSLQKTKFDDYKTQFQELMQKYGKKDIRYLLQKGNSGGFVVNLYCNGIRYGTGHGLKLKEAEKNAAKDALTKLIK